MVALTSHSLAMSRSLYPRENVRETDLKAFHGVRKAGSYLIAITTTRGPTVNEGYPGDGQEMQLSCF